MKTPISAENPFSHDRYGFAFEQLAAGATCLDYGCFDGRFIAQVSSRKAVTFHGVDANSEKVAENPYEQRLTHIKDGAIPFPDATFDYVTILDVIEHVADQDFVLREIYRVLKPEGKLIITAPKKHVFSFLDLGNFKFMAPGLHRFFFTLKNSKEEYERRYVNNPDGMIGDVSADKAWHQHFSEAEMATLLAKNGFAVETFDGSGLFTRVLILLDVCKLGFLIPPGLGEYDYRAFEQMNLFCLARKREG